ncbi:hypothetical protein PL373_18925 [Tenacibaculum maritimum]|nr:hypothetical protein [Tenacibaculum maritimum]MDB0603162.1 hypothetical protein [Tenacibaculum maritimum]MDB0610425.1 hypothetical protein [Tenacibaculum maritimum]
MFIIKVDDKKHEVHYDDFHWFCLGLRCESKEYTVIYPSGYIGEFKPYLKED